MKGLWIFSIYALICFLDICMALCVASSREFHSSEFSILWWIDSCFAVNCLNVHTRFALLSYFHSPQQLLGIPSKIACVFNSYLVQSSFHCNQSILDSSKSTGEGLALFDFAETHSIAGSGDRSNMRIGPIAPAIIVWWSKKWLSIRCDPPEMITPESEAFPQYRKSISTSTLFFIEYIFILIGN